MRLVREWHDDGSIESRIFDPLRRDVPGDDDGPTPCGRFAGGKQSDKQPDKQPDKQSDKQSQQRGAA